MIRLTKAETTAIKTESISAWSMKSKPNGKFSAMLMTCPWKTGRKRAAAARKVKRPKSTANALRSEVESRLVKGIRKEPKTGRATAVIRSFVERAIYFP